MEDIAEIVQGRALQTNQDLIETVTRILKDIKFLEYTWEVREAHGGVIVIGKYLEPDIYSHEISEQATRKWLISPYMTRSEIVQTIFKLCATSMEHRLREHFTYKGARIFGPHFDVDDLWNLCWSGKENAGARK